ncbi:hypothetical protein GCT19_10665 [Paraburkholderia sp. CNPSo 3155]|uniref:hypothetical protein n=1 Tax=Paraburkholderia atlantica TaxID=2654982 RepID=UPI00128DF5F3|nr:hypothetical protein [Paraburkholderia atlantica]MPW06106.1 hypothetical protein [Paraburkholderia atlantica]
MAKPTVAQEKDPLDDLGQSIRGLHQISGSIFLREAETIGLMQVQFGTLVTIANAAPGIDQ